MESPPPPAASVSFRNLGKSGLRVSCLGLGELERRGIKERGVLSWLAPQVSLAWLLSCRYLGHIWFSDLR